MTRRRTAGLKKGRPKPNQPLKAPPYKPAAARAHAHPVAHAHAHAFAASHDHSHPHDHVHDHSHPHDHAHPLPRKSPPSPAELRDAADLAEAHRTPLAALSGEGKTLFFDAASGVAGDMTIAALVDLGVPLGVVAEAVSALPLSGVSLLLERAHAGSIGASRFEVLVFGAQPERTYTEIDAMLATATLDPKVSALARSIFRRLGEAEAEVHRIPLADVHFHEVGAVDAIVDVVGAAACFVHLGAEVACSPLPLGTGFVTCRHGVIPLPAPAAVAALKGAPTYGAGIEAELVTPTGAAIMATVARRFTPWPELVPERIGWGAGTSVLADRPNALRVVLGSAPDGAELGTERTATHVTVEANVDDMTGEATGHAIAALLAAGALDAWACPVVMKKGRPGLVLSALARAPDAERVTGVLLRETTSIGVRLVPVRRVERPRATHLVQTRFGEIPVKVSGGPYGAPVVKPEFDACARAAERSGVAVRVVIEEALALARSIGAL